MVFSRLGLHPARVLPTACSSLLPSSNPTAVCRARRAADIRLRCDIFLQPNRAALSAAARGKVLCAVADQSVAEANPAGKLLGYRQNVGVCLVNRDGRVFAARRLDDHTQTWQMPQGGIDKGESPRLAAVRELREETGVRSARIVGEASTWLQYDFPPEVLSIIRADGRRCHRGQRQKWFLMLFEGDDGEIDLQQEEPEFSEFKWADIHQLPLEVVPFKRQVYEAVVREFAPLIAERLQGGQWVD